MLNKNDVVRQAEVFNNEQKLPQFDELFAKAFGADQFNADNNDKIIKECVAGLFTKVFLGVECCCKKVRL